MSTEAKFGFAMREERMLDLDRADHRLTDHLAQRVPSWLACIKCGACVATCPVGVGALKLSTLQELTTLSHCLLCGKCQLVCPRGIPTRLLAIQIMNQRYECATAI